MRFARYIIVICTILLAVMLTWLGVGTVTALDSQADALREESGLRAQRVEELIDGARVLYFKLEGVEAELEATKDELRFARKRIEELTRLREAQAAAGTEGTAAPSSDGNRSPTDSTARVGSGTSAGADPVDGSSRGRAVDPPHRDHPHGGSAGGR